MNIEKVNKENKKAMKNADTVCFRLKEDGQSVIELSKKMKIDGFETESRINLEVGTRTESYEQFNNDDSYRGYEVEKGFFHIMYANDSLEWQTVVNCLKKDDEIILEWVAGRFNNNIVNENNLTSDSLFLIIKRNDKKVMKFHIDTSITYKNSSVRSIKVKKIEYV